MALRTQATVFSTPHTCSRRANWEAVTPADFHLGGCAPEDFHLKVNYLLRLFLDASYTPAVAVPRFPHRFFYSNIPARHRPPFAQFVVDAKFQIEDSHVLNAICPVLADP